MHALLATVQALAPEDLLLAISYSGERRELNLAADETLRAGAKILAITGFFSQRLAAARHPLSVYDCRRAGDAQRRYLLNTCANDVDRLTVYGAGTTGFRAGAGAYSP